MCRLSSTRRKLPTPMSHRRQPMVMQRRRHVDKFLCVRDGSARQLCTWLSLLLSPSPFSLLARRRSTSGNNACHMANIRIRIMGGRVHVSTLDNRQISECGSISVGAPGRLYNAHRQLMQFAVASIHCHITHLISSIWNRRHMQFLTAACAIRQRSMPPWGTTRLPDHSAKNT